MDIKSIIESSIASVIGEGKEEAQEQVKSDVKNAVEGSGPVKYLKKIKAMEDETGMGAVHSSVHKLGKKASEVTDEAKEKVSGLSKKVLDIMNDHPGISAAAAAALAAGVGGLMLRKRLKAASK